MVGTLWLVVLPTVKTDVDAFGVLLYELFCRQEPYHEHRHVTMVVQRLTSPKGETVPFRPKLRPGSSCKCNASIDKYSYATASHQQI